MWRINVCAAMVAQVIIINRRFKIMKTIIATTSTCLLLGTSFAVFAATPTTPMEKSVAASDVEKKVMAEGEIKKIDKETGKVTIKHGEIKNLDMPPMTMVFRMKDAAMLDKVKAGDKINFFAEKINGNFTVTEIETAK
jgi:Cu(I)/Ag(I) efflux system periplasmic protein CusF